MKIAIYGDSFADVDGPVLLKKTHNCWINYFELEHEVVCYGKSGTSLYYSKQLFDQTHDQYDKVIFMITAPGRYYVKSDKLNHNYYHIAGINKIDQLLKDNTVSKMEKHRLQIYRDYMLHVRDDVQEEYTHNLMVQDIARRRSDTIIIPCFNNSIYSENVGLWDISDYEFSTIMKLSYPLRDMRRCHLTKENNFRLFQLINNSINTNQTKVDLRIENFVSDFDQTQTFIWSN